MAAVYDTAWFISKARAVWGDKYDYSLSVFTGAKNPVTIICRQCGPILIKCASDHYQVRMRCGRLKACGCKSCERKESLAEKGRFFECIRCGNWAKYKDHIGRCEECHRKEVEAKLSKRSEWERLKEARRDAWLLTQGRRQDRFCVDCGVLVTKKSTRCRNCVLKMRGAAQVFAADPKICDECGSHFVPRLNGKHCSVKCERRSQRRRRRALKINAYIEHVSLFELAERDGWMCGICGKNVDPLETGKARASIDHVIPLAKGGLHEYSNCQLAHADCNSGKCDRLLTLF